MFANPPHPLIKIANGMSDIFTSNHTGYTSSTDDEPPPRALGARNKVEGKNPSVRRPENRKITGTSALE